MNRPTHFKPAPDPGRHKWSPSDSANLNTPQPLFVDSELFIRQTFETNPEKGYELLFKRYYQPLCNHAVRFVYRKDVAEDLVTDVFSRFWQKQLHKSVTTSIRAYLFTTVRHAALAYLRKEFGKKDIPTDDFSDLITATTPTTPQQELQFNELYLKIEQVIRALSPQRQKVFIMSRFEGKKNSTIAEELQISIKTVEGHMTKVLSVLRQSLQDYGLVTLLIGFSYSTIQQGVNQLFSLLQATVPLHV